MKSDAYNGGSSWHSSKRTCLGRLTRLELCLAIFSFILLLLLTILSLLWLTLLQGYRTFTEGRPIYPPEYNYSIGVDRSAVNHDGVVCTTKECVMIAGFFAQNLNTNIDPCSDFYEFACGNYPLNNDLPASKPLRHTISDVQSKLNKQVKSILEEKLSSKDKPWDQLVKSYYQKCLDEDDLERNGFIALKEIIHKFGGWPTLNGSSWKEWDHGWEKQLGLLVSEMGVNAVVLEMTVSHDPANSSQHVIELDQPKWGVGSRWPYLMGPNDPMIRNYTHLMTTVAIALGADPQVARRDMQEAMELELKLVNFSADEMVRRNPDRGNNRFQLWQLKAQFPLIDFDDYIRTAFGGVVNVSPNETVIVRELDYFAGIQHVMSSTRKRVIANYLQWRLVQGFSPFFPSSAREPFYEFKANQTGLNNSPPPDRWEDCVTLSVILLEMPVGKLFVEHFFDKERAMDKMHELTAYMKAEFIKQLRVLDWMDDTTRTRAIAKAHAIEYKTGFSHLLFNDTWMQSQWPIDLKPREHLLHFTIRLKLVRWRDELRRLHQMLDREVWEQTPAQADAFYNPHANEMIFPAGIMQFPFLTIAPNYVTYAMVGAVIGHEVSHAFDDQGRQHDELGNLNEWWDPLTAEKFTEKSRCFIRQYGSVKIEEANINLNGHLSLGENIADNGGVKTAFNAYQAWRSNTSTRQEPALPGFQQYTSEQMFFLAYANNWCSLVRPKHYVQLVLTDVHAPSKYRAIIPLQNRPEFSKAFNCQKGSIMNPIDKCQVW